MLSAVMASSLPDGRDGWELPTTNHWLYQFVIGNADLPALSRWHPSPAAQFAVAATSPDAA
jgi:hypothetical protein